MKAATIENEVKGGLKQLDLKNWILSNCGDNKIQDQFNSCTSKRYTILKKNILCTPVIS